MLMRDCCCQLYNTALTLFDAGDEVITHAPGWPTLVEQIKLADATPVIVRTTADTGFALMLEAQARGHRLFTYTPDKLTLRDGKVTAVISPRGQVERSAPEFTRAIVTHDVSGFQGATPYVRCGNYGVLAIIASGVVAGETVVTEGHLRLAPGMRVVVRDGRPRNNDKKGGKGGPPAADAGEATKKKQS